MNDEQITILKELLARGTYTVWWVCDEGWRQLTGTIREHDDEMKASITNHCAPPNNGGEYIDLYNVSPGTLVITSRFVGFDEVLGDGNKKETSKSLLEA